MCAGSASQALQPYWDVVSSLYTFFTQSVKFFEILSHLTEGSAAGIALPEDLYDIANSCICVTHWDVCDFVLTETPLRDDVNGGCLLRGSIFPLDLLVVSLSETRGARKKSWA